MLTVPVALTRLIVKFAPVFSKRVWEHVQVLVVGALLAPGKRTVTAVLRVMGRSQGQQFQKYHRVLNRAQWSSLALARVLLTLLVHTFVAKGPVVIGVDDTLERRRGAKIKAKGIYRDAVRSSRAQVVKARGLRWLCAMLLPEIPWAGRVWALPFLTALCPSERYHQQRGQRHKTLAEWAGQLIGLIHRWLPGREVVVVADSSYAVIELLGQVRATPGMSLITRLRLDAALYDPAPPRAPRQNGRPRKKGARRPTLQHVLTDPQTPWTPHGFLTGPDTPGLGDSAEDCQHEVLIRRKAALSLRRGQLFRQQKPHVWTHSTRAGLRAQLPEKLELGKAAIIASRSSGVARKAQR